MDKMVTAIQAARQAISSMKIEGYKYTPEEEKDLYELSAAEYYRKMNNKYPGTLRLRIVITECGHNPNWGNKKKMPNIGCKIKCLSCKETTFITDIVV